MEGSLIRPCGLGVLLCFVLTGTAFAQLEGRFYLEKERYAVGEPVFLYFDFANTGKQSAQVVVGNSYSPCGGFSVEVSPGPRPANSSCAGGVAGSCVGTKILIAPGETRHDKVLLNYEHDLSKSGTYQIIASRTLGYGPATEGWPNGASAERLNIEAQFRIQVVGGSDESLLPMFQPYVADLGSKNEERQQEAAMVIGSLAPRFLEETILSMLDAPVSRPFALLGLRRLNTAISREALASIVQRTADYSFEKEQAIKYLSEMGDKKYLSLLLDEAKKQQPNQARDYVLAAAELGGEEAMPYIASLLQSPDPFSRANAAMALPRTGSRRAVPVLIDLLRSPDADLRRLASIGLIQLTHRSPFESSRNYSDSTSREYPDWVRWWRLQGDGAPIYGPNQCGEVKRLE